MQRLLLKSGYRAPRGPGVARPRQTDLFASKGQDEYIIEAKWKKDPADVAELANLRDRLNRVPSSVMGMFFSMSGFTQSLIADLEARRDRVVLLIDDDEVVHLFRGNLRLDVLIREKRDHFVRDGRVVFHRNPAPWHHRPIPDQSALSRSDLRIVTPDGSPLPWIVGAGDFNPVVFASELPDVDHAGAQGSGVGFDLRVRTVKERKELAYVIETLKDVGWIKGSMPWRKKQLSHFWVAAAHA